MVSKLTPAEIQHFQVQLGQTLDRAVAMSLIEHYTTRVITRRIKLTRSNTLISEVVYIVGDTGLGVGHHKGLDPTHGTFTLLDTKAMLVEARASLGI